MKKKTLCLLLSLALAACTLYGCKSSSDDNKTQEPTDAVGSAQEEEQETEAAAKETVICDQDGIKITATRLEKNEKSDWALDLKVENHSDKNISVGVSEIKANDVVVDSCEFVGALHPVTGEPHLEMMKMAGMTVIDAAPGSTEVAEDVTYALGADVLKEKNISELEKVTVSLAVSDADNPEAPLLLHIEGVEIPVE